MRTGRPTPGPDTHVVQYYHNKAQPTATPLTIKTRSSNSSAQSSLSQATIAAASKVKGPVPKFSDEFLTSGIDATYSTAHATPFYGVVVVDGADDLFMEKASSAMLYPRDRA